MDLISWLINKGFSIDPSLDGTIQRFDRDGKKNGWFIGSHISLRSGNSAIIATVGDWKTEEKYVFKSFEAETAEDKKDFERKIREQSKIVHKEKEKIQKQAAKDAKKIWDSSLCNGESQYLEKKKIRGLFGCRIEAVSWPRQAALLIPCWDIDGKLAGLQRIFPNGDKYFCEGQKKSGCFHYIQGKNPSRIWIGEGFATMATIAMATNDSVVVAFDAGNLRSVAELIAQKYPDAAIIIAGDDDIWKKGKDGSPLNIGRLKAEAAAEAIGVPVVFPFFENPIKDQTTDFNDLMIFEGLEAVKEQLSQVDPRGGKTHSEIVTNGRQLREIIDDSWKAIRKQNRLEPNLFNQNGMLCRLNTKDNGTVIQPVGFDEMNGILLRVADWISLDSEKEKHHSRPPKDVVRDLVVNFDPRMPKLNSIIRMPAVTKSGILIQTPGYYRDEGIYADPLGYFGHLEVPKYPSSKEISESYNLLAEELLGDFPFVEELDRTHAIAAIVQSFLRPRIDGPTPFFAIEAPSPGTGKGLLSEIICLILGNSAAVESFPNNDDEVRKKITSRLLESPTVMMFDNLTGDSKKGEIDSRSLAAAITSVIWNDRLLGTNKTISLPVQCLWLITGNNLKFSEELKRRRIPIRLDANTKTPWTRDNFRHKPLNSWVKNNRLQLVRAILILIQNWIVNGSPQSSKILGSFESWAQNVGGLLEINEISSFLGHIGKENLDDIEWVHFVNAWWKHHEDELLTPGQLNKLCEKEGLLIKIRGYSLEKSQETNMGNALKQKQNRVFGNYQIVLAQDKGKHGRYYCLRPAQFDLLE